MGRFNFKSTSPQAGQFYSGQSFDFTQGMFVGGVNYAALPTALDFEKELLDCENVAVMLDGFLRTRPGLLEDTSITDATVINGIGRFKGKTVLATGGYIYYDNTAIGTCSSTEKVEFLNYHDYLVIMDGGYLCYFDGSTYTRKITGPKMKFGFTYLDRIWCAGDSSYPYRVWVNGPNDIDDWGSTGLMLGTFFDFDPFDSATGQPNEISGLGLIFDAVVVFKRGDHPRIFRIDGQDNDSFQTHVVKEGVTSINPYSLAFTPIGLTFLSHDGIHILNPSNGSEELISYKINRDLLNIDQTKLVSTYAPEYGLYMIGYDATLYVLNVYSKGWFKWTFTTPSVQTLKSFDGVTYMGSGNGYVYSFSDTVVEDNSEDFQIEIETGYYSFGSYGITKTIYACYMLLNNSEGTDINVDITKNYAALYGQSMQSIRTQDGTVVYENLVIGGDSSAGFRIVLESEIQELTGWDDDDLAWDVSTQVGFDGGTFTPSIYKIPLNMRCNNISLLISCTSSPIVLQSIEFMGNVLKPAP